MSHYLHHVARTYYDYIDIDLNMNLKMLYILLCTEVLLGLHRDVSLCSSKIRTAYIYFRSLFEVLFIIVNVVIEFSYGLFKVKYGAAEHYFYFSNVTSMFIIFLSHFTSDKFQKIKSKLEINQNIYFKNDMRYNKNMERNRRKITFLVVPFCFMHTVVMIYVRTTQSDLELSTELVILTFLSNINLSMCEFRFVLEFVMLYCVLFITSQQLDCITRSIDRYKLFSSTMFPGENDSWCVDQWSHEDEDNVVREMNEIRTAYVDILECSNLFNEVFSFQLFIMLATLAVLNTTILYTATTLTVFFGQNVSNIHTYIYGVLVLVYLTALYHLSKEGQSIKNTYAKLRRRLTKFITFSQNNYSNGQVYKMIKDLLRLIAMRRISITTLAALEVDMDLLLSCLVFSTSYAVIALQMNHVI